MPVTFELYEALKSIGINEEKARATAEKFEEALENKFDAELKNLATKEDLSREIFATKEDLLREISQVRQELANAETRIIKWNVGTLIAVVGITVAIIKLIS